jgi:hypothetical protein
MRSGSARAPIPGRSAGARPEQQHLRRAVDLEPLLVPSRVTCRLAQRRWQRPLSAGPPARAVRAAELLLAIAWRYKTATLRKAADGCTMIHAYVRACACPAPRAACRVDRRLEDRRRRPAGDSDDRRRLRRSRTHVQDGALRQRLTAYPVRISPSVVKRPISSRMGTIDSFRHADDALLEGAPGGRGCFASARGAQERCGGADVLHLNVCPEVAGALA